MTTPICLAHPWLHLDGILSHLIFREKMGLNYYTLPSKQPLSRRDLMNMGVQPRQFMPLARLGPIYHASVSFLEPKQLYTVTIYKRFHERHAETLRRKYIQRSRGRFRDWAIKLPIIPAEKVVFYAYGDLHETLRLLNHLPGLGKKVNIGFGAFKSIEIEELKEDHSVVWRGKAMRPIPVKMCAYASETMLLAYRPPYWDRRNIAECAVPGSRVELKQKYVEKLAS